MNGSRGSGSKTAIGWIVLCIGCADPLGVSLVAVDVDGSVTVSPMEREAFNVTAQNLSEERVVWGFGSSSCQFGLVVEDHDGIRHNVDFRDCTTDLVEHALDAEESRTETFLWGGTILLDSQWQVLPSGEYRLFGLAGDRESAPILVKVMIP